MSPSKGHYHKQVDVRVPLRFAVGIRSEQDNFLWVKLARDLRAELFDLSGRRFPKDMMSWSLQVIQPFALANRRRPDYTSGAVPRKREDRSGFIGPSSLCALLECCIGSWRASLLTRKNSD